MGIDTTAWIAYAAPVKGHQYGDDFDDQLSQHDGVGHLSAGDYDRDVLYFVTYAESADLGRPEAIPADALHPAQCLHWTEQIRRAAEACGVELAADPGWLLIAAQS